MTMSKKRLGLHGIVLEARDVPAALDPTFGVGGTAIFGNANTTSPQAYRTTADGRILTVVNNLNDDATSSFGIRRLTTSGAADTSYDGDGTLELNALLASKRDGLAKTDPTGRYALSPSSTLSEAPGGKWLVTTNYVQFPKFISETASPAERSVLTFRQVVRLNNDGTLDATYGSGGVVTQSIPISEASKLGDSGSIVGPDGSLFIVRAIGGIGLPIDPSTSPGVVFPSSFGPAVDLGKPGVFAVTKLKPDGSVDTGFGTNGTATITSGLTLSALAGLAPTGKALADGSLILTGTVEVLKDGEAYTIPYAYKLTPQGALDAAYGTGGKAVFPVISGINDKRLSVSLNSSKDAAEFDFTSAKSTSFTTLADGSIVGTVVGQTSGTAFLIRFGKDGKPDTAFGTNGVATIDSNYFLDVDRASFSSIEVLPASNGGFYLASRTAVGFVIQKRTAAGAVDTSFGRNGIAVLSTPFAIPDVTAKNGQTPTLPNGGAFGNFEISGSDKLIVGGFLNTKKTPSDPDLLRSIFTRIDLNAPTPALPAEPKRIDLSAGNAVTEQIGNSDTGEVRFDLNGDGKAEIIRFERAKSLGSTSRLGIVDGKTGDAIVNNFRPFEAAYVGGLIVTGGDLDGDGKAELIVAPDVGGSARIQVFKVVNGQLVQSDNFFAIEDLNFRGGARLAAADLNGDGKADLVVSAGPGGGPRVAIYDGADLGRSMAKPRKLLGDFFAYTSESDLKLRNGASVAVNDVNGDGVADLFIGPSVGGAPRLTIFDGKKLATQGIDVARRAPLVDKFLGGDSTSREGVQFFLKPKADGTGNDVVAVNRGNNSQTLNGASDPLL